MFLRSREKSKLILCKIFHLIRSWEKFSVRIFKHCVAYCKQSLNVYWIKNIQSPNVKSQMIFPNNSIIISLIFNISDWYNWKIQSKIVVKVQLYHSFTSKVFLEQSLQNEDDNTHVYNSDSSLDQIK